jgi:hypothetical protein
MQSDFDFQNLHFFTLKLPFSPHDLQNTKNTKTNQKNLKITKPKI